MQRVSVAGARRCGCFAELWSGVIIAGRAIAYFT